MHPYARSLIVAGAALASAGADASCGTGANGVAYCGPELMQLLYVAQSGAVYVRPTTALSPTPANFPCAPVSGAYFVLLPSAPGFKQLYAALLSAKLAGAPVTIVSDPAQAACTIGYVTF